MLNSELVKQKLIKMAEADLLPSDMNQLDSDLFDFCDPEIPTDKKETK